MNEYAAGIDWEEAYGKGAFIDGSRYVIAWNHYRDNNTVYYDTYYAVYDMEHVPASVEVGTGVNLKMGVNIR